LPWTKVYIDKAEFEQTLAKEGLRGKTYREAIWEAQVQLLRQDERVFLLGEGVTDPGGIFGSTSGLVQEFGRDRVLDIPIAENGLTGVAIGAALAGMRPIFIHMRMDFLPMCMDQITNHAAKWHYMTGGKVNVPLVIRSIIGRGWGSAAQHSQALHGLFMHIPGLKVVMPSTPYDAKGLLIAAVQDGNPVLFVEHRWIYDYIGYVPEAMYTIPIGKGIIRKPGKDVTIVALSQMIYEAMKAAKVLAQEGIDVEILDPRTLKPLDDELICESVKKTGRLVIADVACQTGGVGAEIACRVAELAFQYLKAPVKRVNFPDVPTPCSPVLEEAYYPDARTIIQVVKDLFEVKGEG
jgi:pyruvate/2-oxoglutarate/acetoin dehydrogenase E1 component